MVRLTLSILPFLAPASLAQWTPAHTPLSTRWSVNPDAPHHEYPRPQLVRDEWMNLNGTWEYALTRRAEPGAPPPSTWDGEILVPFPIESSLSGVGRRVTPDQTLWYRRTFRVPDQWRDRSILVNLGAADWESQVYVNRLPGDVHRGGFKPISEDIASRLKPGAEQEIIVRVWDPTDQGPQPRGKQVGSPEGIWYTPTTGIWQTIWIEPVPERRVASLRIVPDLARSSVKVKVNGPSYPVTESVIAVFDGARQVASTRGFNSGELELVIPGAKLWSPESPFLYTIEISLLDGGKPLEKVRSYFGMREVSLAKDDQGRTRLALNGKPYFMLGVLDQGFWPDGLYTPPTDEALRYDLEVLKDLGFNTVRKHVKIESARWYAWCDRLGFLVFQDMPSGDAFPPQGELEIRKSPIAAADFESELKAMIAHLANHPSVVMWIPFNEGWGQYDTVRLTNDIKALDPTRLVTCASGWNDFPVGDVIDIHAYPGPASPDPEDTRAAVLGEFGGLGLVIPEHAWKKETSWGYQNFPSPEALTDAYVRLLDAVRRLHHQRGLSAAIYTQTSDVEIEVNGLLTYDRARLKVDRDRVRAANLAVHRPPPELRLTIPAADVAPATWRFSTADPGERWAETDFDDSAWTLGPSGFGSNGTPGSIIGTRWLSSDLWIRRAFSLPPDVDPARLSLYLHHDEDAVVFINGVEALRVRGYTTDYQVFPISSAARRAIRSDAPNILAIHCRQTRGGQYIDAGLVEELPEHP